MHALLFPTYLLNESSRAVAIELGRELIRSGKKLTVLVCTMKKGNCEINPYGNRILCRSCKQMAGEVIQLINPDSVINFDGGGAGYSISTGERRAILKASYGVFANIIRSSMMNLLNKHERKFIAKIYKRSVFLQKYIGKLINGKNSISEIYTFNGRYPSNIVAVHEAKKNRIDYFLYEIWLQKTPIISKNDFIHNSSFARFVVDRIKSSHTKESIYNTASEYLSRRISGQYYFFDNPVISAPAKKNNQIKNQGNSEINIVVCPSSTFEYNYHPYGFDVCNQPYEIQSLINNLNNQIKTTINVRLHPNMSSSPIEEVREYLNIKTSSKNHRVNIIEPRSNLSTYDLIDDADYVIAFASFTSCEATLMNKKVIQIGPSRYSKLKFSKNTDNGYQAAEKINKSLIFNEDDDKYEAAAFIASIFDNSYFRNDYKLGDDLTIHAGKNRIQNTRIMIISNKVVKIISYIIYGRLSVVMNLSKIKKYIMAIMGNKVAY